MILIIFAASILFLALYNYNNNVNQAVNIEELRAQERINLVPFLSDEGDTTTFTAVRVNNTGSITCQIRAVYVNNVFWCDPSDISLNPDGAYITAHTSKLINILPLPYNPTDKITIATDRL